MKDLWSGRREMMRCRNCITFVRKHEFTPGQLVNEIAKPAEVPKIVADRGCVGRCRRHAPTMYGYPVVFENDWCGDFKLSED